MKIKERVAHASFLLALIAIASGCVVAEPREGYYDHDHHRYYHEHVWHECVVGDPFCR